MLRDVACIVLFTLLRKLKKTEGVPHPVLGLDTDDAGKTNFQI
jgi:hypothetical protein